MFDTSQTFFIPDNSPWLMKIFSAIVGFVPTLGHWLQDFLGFLVGMSLVLSVFFLIVIIYCVERLKVLRNKQAEIYDAKVDPGFETVETGDNILAHRWENAMKHIDSTNPNDWKQAILEADIILDDLLTRLGYKGESVGEKLKRVVTGDMKSLNEAWEAHKVRNSIAHESGFQLDHHVAKHTIAMYKKVFEEFYYI